MFSALFPGLARRPTLVDSADDIRSTLDEQVKPALTLVSSELDRLREELRRQGYCGKPLGRDEHHIDSSADTMLDEAKEVKPAAELPEQQATGPLNFGSRDQFKIKDMTGFFIHRDGFMLTTPFACGFLFLLSWSLYDPPKYMHHVDRDRFNLTVVTMPAPECYMQPAENVSEGEQVLLVALGLQRPLDVPISIGILCHIRDVSGEVEVDDRRFCTEANAARLRGGGMLVNSMSGKFVGIVTAVEMQAWTERGRATFCSLTSSSPAWLAVVAAIKRFQTAQKKNRVM